MTNNNWLWGDETELSDAEKWDYIRRYRNELLARCDWTQLPDAVLTFDQRTAWQNYRQDLRDLPNQAISPDDVIFPEAPQ